MINYRLGALIGSGCDTITGISFISNNKLKFQLYPNPATDIVQLDISNRDLNEQLFFVLYDMLGEELLRRNIPLYQIQVARNNLSSGIYQWQIQSGAGEVRAKGKFVWE